MQILGLQFNLLLAASLVALCLTLATNSYAESTRSRVEAEEALKALSQIENVGDYPGAVIDLLDHLSVEERQAILETDCLSHRLAVTLEELYKGLNCER